MLAIASGFSGPPGSYQVCVQLIMPNKSIACARPRLASRAKIGSIFISRPVTVSTIARYSRTIVLRFAGGKVVKFSTLCHRSADKWRMKEANEFAEAIRRVRVPPHEGGHI